MFWEEMFPMRRKIIPVSRVTQALEVNGKRNRKMLPASRFAPFSVRICTNLALALGEEEEEEEEEEEGADTQRSQI